MFREMKKVIVFIVLVGMVLPGIAQKALLIDSSQINNLVREFKDNRHIPGIAVGIAVGRDVRYVNFFGVKDVETGSALTDHSIWPICSITKQFTTIASLKLIEENMLSFDNRLSQYFDSLPLPYREITVGNLLSMTSGLKDYLNEKKIYDSTWENVRKAILADTLNFRPGKAWSYSNTGFWMAAKIIENITGMDYHQYLKQTFFDEFNMDNTRRFSPEFNNGLMVKGYRYKDKKFEAPLLDLAKFHGQGDGELTTTLSDLLKWNIALVHGELVEPDLIAGIWTPVKLNNGETTEIAPNSGMSYGMGWFIQDIDGQKTVWTPGSGFGFSTTSLYVPGYDLSIIVFCNKEQFLIANELGFEIQKMIISGNSR